MTLEELYDRVITMRNELQDGTIIRSAIEPYSEDILEQQRIQLLEGKTSSGEDLRPYYSEDLKPEGYFYSVESAGRYAAWKGSLSYPYSVSRSEDMPNLYINGRFHSELDVQFTQEGVAIVAGTGYTEGIMLKYGLDNFGLTEERWEELMSSTDVVDALREQVNNILFYGN